MTQTDAAPLIRNRAEEFLDTMVEETGGELATANKTPTEIIVKYLTVKLEQADEGKLPVSTTLACTAGDDGMIGFLSNQKVTDPSVINDPKRVPEDLILTPIICLEGETPSTEAFW